MLQNPKAKLNRKAIHWHYPHYHHDLTFGAIRERDWKLIEYLYGTGEIELYHITQDLSESDNLAGERKGKFADLKQKLSTSRSEVLARIPIPIHPTTPNGPTNGGVAVQANRLTVLPAKDFLNLKNISNSKNEKIYLPAFSFFKSNYFLHRTLAAYLQGLECNGAKRLG